MKRLVLPALAVALSSACIVYDEDVIYNEHGEYGDTDLGTWSNPERPASEDPPPTTMASMTHPRRPPIALRARRCTRRRHRHCLPRLG